MAPYSPKVCGVPKGFALGNSTNLPLVTGPFLLITNLPQAMLLLIITGSSYERLCLRLYLALCLRGSSGRSLWLLSDVILLNKVLHSSSLRSNREAGPDC